MHIPGVVVITGIMAAGKSTVAQLLAERLDRSVHLRGDQFRRAIVSGRVDMSATPSPEAIDQLHLRYRLSGMVADEYARSGFTVVLQDIVLGGDLVGYLDGIHTTPTHLVVLAPRPEVVLQREAGRTKTGYSPGLTPVLLDAGLRTAPAGPGLWLDSSDQRPEQTVDAVLDRLGEARVR